MKGRMRGSQKAPAARTETRGGSTTGIIPADTGKTRGMIERAGCEDTPSGAAGTTQMRLLQAFAHHIS